MFGKILAKLQENEVRIEDPESITKIRNVMNIMLRDIHYLKPYMFEGCFSIIDIVFKEEVRSWVRMKIMLRRERRPRN